MNANQQQVKLIQDTVNVSVVVRRFRRSIFMPG